MGISPCIDSFVFALASTSSSPHPHKPGILTKAAQGLIVSSAAEKSAFRPQSHQEFFCPPKNRTSNPEPSNPLKQREIELAFVAGDVNNADSWADIELES
jgi:hypothetical protein